MDEISNKTLMAFLIAAIVISIGGTIISLERISRLGAPEVAGYATTGTANLTVLGTSAVVVNKNVDFGSGSPSSDITNQTVITTETNNTGGFNDCTAGDDCLGLELENTGNVNLNITITAASDSDAFWSGTDTQGSFQFFVADGNRSKDETGSCHNASGAIVTEVSDWTAISTSPILMCYNFTYPSATDTLTVEFNLTIPTDEPVGYKENTFTFGFTQIS